MKNLQNGLKEKICESKITKKCLALLLALSMTVGFVMPYEEVFESTIKTAFAANDNEDDAGNVITTAYTTQPDGAVDFGKNITGFDFADSSVIELDGGSSDKATAKLKLTYNFTENPGVNQGQRYIYYQLPEGVTVREAVQGSDKAVRDDGWEPEIPDPITSDTAGWYSISKDGLIVIKLTKLYIEDKINSGGFEGAISFDGDIQRDGTAIGDREVVINGQKIKVKFDDVIKEDSKQSRITTNEVGDMVIHYIITVNNPAKNVDFKQYNFKDTLINSSNAQNGKITNVVSNPAGCINKDLTFTDKAKEQTSFTIEYDYTPTADEIANGTQIINEAEIVNKTNPEDKAKTKEETEVPRDSIKATITKSGTLSYLATENSTTGYIEWTINVKRDYNLSLKDYVITDSAFSGIDVPVSEGSSVKKAEIISVKNKNGSNVPYSHDANSNDIKIEQDTDDVTITYHTYVGNNGSLLAGNDEGTDVNNRASVTPPPKDPGGNPPPPDDFDEEKVHYSESSSIEKTGSSIEIDGYDKLNKPESIPVELEWTVKISDFGEIKGGKTYTDTLDGGRDKQWFTDDQITEIKNQLAKYYLSENTDYTIETNVSEGIIVGFTINFLQGIEDNHIKKLELVYHSTAETKDIAFNSSATFKNTGTYDKPDEGEVTVKRKNDPYSGNTTGYTGNKIWNDSNNLNRPEAWLMLQYRIEGGEWKNYPQIDGIENPKLASGYINWQGLPKTRPAMNGEEEKSYYYRIIEVVPDGNGGYTEGTPDGYTVSYYCFENWSGGVNYKYDEGFKADVYGNKTLDITNTYAYFDATVYKNWQNAPDNHPTTVQFTLYQTTTPDVEDSWTKVENVTPTQNGDSYTFSNLPRKTADGKTIYYKVEEVSIPDYTVSYPTNFISETNTSWTVINTYDKMAINAIKNWVGDAGSESSRPNSITVHLESTQTPNDANSWQTVADSSQTLNEGNEWKYTWSELPRKDSNNNPIYYRIREDANQSPEYEANYEKQYISDPNSYDEDFVINNVWKKVNITPQKKWVGDKPLDRTETLEFKLQYKVGANGEWKDHTESDDNVIKNASNITINVDRSNDADDTDTATTSWKNLPREVNGVKCYYRAVEINSNSKYVATYDENGINQTGNSVVTNTFDTIEITPAKKWVGDEGHEEDRYDVTFKLQWKYENETSFKSIDDASTPNGIKNIGTITISKQNGAEWVDNTNNGKWANLPKTHVVDGVRKNIQYQVVEVTENENYTSSPSSPTNTGGTLYVTNTYNFIKITASKTWSKDTSSDRPETITVHLEQSTDDGTTWTTVEYSEQTFDVTDSMTLTYDSWNKLPKKTDDGKTISYRVVEDSVKGYSVSYSPETINGNSGTIAITNTKKSSYGKVAIDPTASIDDGTYIPTLQEITTISAKDLKNVPTDSNGNYIFIWKVTIPKGEYVKYIDTLPEDVKYADKYFVSYDFNDPNGEKLYINNSNIVISKNDNTITFDYNSNAGVTGFVYYTTISKDIVDNAVAENGYYELSNNIKREGDEDDGITASLIIGSKTDLPGDKQNITKSYDSSRGNDKLNVYARYSIEINPDAKKLSNEDYLDLSDLFEVTGYKEPNGTEHRETGLLDATIHNIVVEDMETGEKVTDYIYYPPEINKEKELVKLDSSAYSLTDDHGSPDGWFTFTSNEDLSAYTEFIFEIQGTPNQNVDLVLQTYGYTDGIKVEEIDKQYNTDGKAQVKVILEKKVEKDKKICFYVANCNSTVKVISAGTEQLITKNVNSFKVPDERHLKITYYYSLTVNDKTPGTDLKVGDKPPADSEVFFKNEASVNTSDGKEISETDEVHFVVQKSDATVTTADIPKIEKVDIGNYAVNNLNATFKLAKYDNGNWVYATGFTPDEKNVIQIDYNDSKNENSGVIPDNAGNLVINGITQINLNPNTLYKLVEVDSPEGYKSTPYTSGTDVNSADMKDFVFYFVYGGKASDFTSSGIEATKIMQISSGGTIDIPNINLIDISVSKTWAQIPENTNNVTAKFKLYYSTKRSSTIPTGDDLIEVPDSEKEVTFTLENDSLKQNGEIKWTNLPNGKDGKPIYYYVKEESYTINGTTYTLENGEYKALYSGNALSKNGEVKVTNTKGLYVQKEWKKSDGKVMDTAPVKSIQFLLEGKTSAGTWQTIRYSDAEELWTLNETNKWQINIPDDKLTGYVDFKVTEKLTKEQSVSLYCYVVSYTKNLNGNSGVLEISNKNPFANEIDFIVNKEWADGLPADEHSGVEVTLYRANDINKTGAEKVTADKDGNTIINPVTLDASNSWSAEWKGLDNLQDNGQRYYYYTVETVPTGYTASYEKTGLSVQRETITNTPETVVGKLSVQKKWEKVSDLNSKEITLNLYRRKKASTTETYNIPSNINVVCIGDSITQGTMNNTSDVTYPKKLAELLRVAESNVKNLGNDGDENLQITARVDGTATNSDKKIESLAGVDVVCLIAGTNDVIHSKRDNAADSFENLVKAIFTKAQSDNNTKLKVYIGTIPYITRLDWYWGTAPNQKTSNDWVEAYNTAIESKVASLKTDGYNVELVDINSVVDVIDENGNALSGGETMLVDGCHPNADGYRAIAQAFYTAIGEYYGKKAATSVDTSNVQTDIDYVPTDFTTDEFVEEFKLKSGNWTKSWEKLPTTVTENGITYEYIYYVKEVTESDKWQESYQHNGQPANGQMTITVTNTGNDDTPKASVKVKKEWLDGTSQAAVHPDSVKVQLYSSDRQDGDYTLVTGTEKELTETGNWTATWENLETGRWYKAVDSVTGWKSDSDAVQLTEASTGANISVITLTNTLEKGKLQIDKEWLGNANVDEVKVELYRVAVDENGNPISNSGSESTTGLSTANAMYSLTRLKRTFAQIEAQNSEQEASQQETTVETEETTETPKNKFSLSPMKSTVSARAVADTEDYAVIEKPKAETEYKLIDTSEPYYCGDKEIKRIEIEFNNDASQYNGVVAIGYYDDYTNIYYPHMEWFLNEVYNGDSVRDNVYTIEKSLLTKPIEYFKWFNYGGHTVKEIRFIYDKQGPSISFANPTDNKAVVGDKVTITPTTLSEGATVVYSCSEASVNISENEITFNNTGNFTITATAKDSANLTATATITYTVSDFAITGNETTIETPKTIKEDSAGFTLSANNTSGTVEWKSSNDNILSVDENTGEVTVNGVGKVSITAKRTDNEQIYDTIYYNVTGNEIDLSANKTTLHNDGKSNTANLTVKVNGQTVTDNITWSVISGDSVIVNNGVVTAVGNGESTIRAERGGQFNDITINVADLKVSLNNQPITSLDSVMMNVNDEKTFEINNISGTANCSLNGDESGVTASISDNKLTIKSSDTESENITLTVSDDSQTVTFKVAVKIKEADADIPNGAEKIDTITIRKSNDWKSDVIENLELTDGNGHYYQYYIKEVENDKYIPISYIDNGQTLNVKEQPKVIRLKNKPKETSVGVELPETGGIGTKPYTVIGLSFMSISAAIMFIRRRRRMIKRS